jgi:putative transposase
MLVLMFAILGAVRSALRSRSSLVAENLALRQQLAVLSASRRPRLRPVDRTFWVVLSRVWSRWADVLTIVKPETVINWHRRGFAKFWAYKSRRHGRPPLADEIVQLIVRMTHDNPTWSRRRIATELAMLGIAVSKDTVARYMPKGTRRPRTPPSMTWGAFIRMHLAGTVAIDFLSVRTVTFRTLYVFIVLSLQRRVLLHANVTAHPDAIAVGTALAHDGFGLPPAQIRASGTTALGSCLGSWRRSARRATGAGSSGMESSGRKAVACAAR